MPICALCKEAESKYTCPTCNLRYCSVACYKPHRLEHETDTNSSSSITHATAKVDRPGTTQRIAKLKFDGFDQDEEFKRLLLRFPLLKTELQGVFALTLDPGPEEARSWNKMWLPMLDRAPQQLRGSTRGRGARGRGGSARGGKTQAYELPEGREHGAWSKEKGDREALFVMKKVQNDINNESLSEGLQEFVELIQLRFGDRQKDT